MTTPIETNQRPLVDLIDLLASANPDNPETVAAIEQLLEMASTADRYVTAMHAREPRTLCPTWNGMAKTIVYGLQSKSQALRIGAIDNLFHMASVAREGAEAEAISATA